MSSARFASLNASELEKITEARLSENTKNATKYAVRTFRTYLHNKEYPEDFENYTKSDLDARLRTFYAELRNGKGDLYKRTSLLSMRSGLGRHLIKSNGYDISKDAEFNNSNEMFSAMCKKINREGKGGVTHKEAIEPEDMNKLYTSFVFDVTTPCGLLNKVWFELCMYFCRRGRENQRDLVPSMFELQKDDKGLQYICQTASEVTKNHQGLSSIEIDSKTVRMYETKTENCPVKSFIKYLSKRNPNCSALFQTPRNSFDQDDDIWYENRPLGKNKLGSMMVEISKRANLSRSYTNHCIRATTISALSNAGFEARHIMTVSGHRNETSVKSYVRDTTSEQKRQMSSSISHLAIAATSVLSTEQTELQSPSEIEKSFLPQQNNSEFDDEHDDMLCLSASQTETMLTDITNFEAAGSCDASKNVSIIEKTVNKTSTLGYKTSRPAQFDFHGCTVNLYYNQQ